jgi:acyl-CoA synthetase (AMP-forming)/AMP-acid ligase II
MSDDLYRQLEAQATRYPERPAIRQRRSGGGYEITTYRQLAEKARRFAAALLDGAPEATVIPLYLRKSADAIAAAVGAAGAGKAFAWLNRKLRAPQLEAILEACGPSVLLADESSLMALEDTLMTQSAKELVAAWVLPAPARRAAHEAVFERLARAAPVSFWPAPPSTPTPAALPELPYDSRAPGCCLFTSGSTGAPKGVLVSRSDLAARARAEVQLFGLNGDSVLLSILPFSFDVGLNQLCCAISVGCEIVLLDSWLPADILDAAEECEVTGISGVPSIWQGMINAGLKFDTRQRHVALEYLTISGGDLVPANLERMVDLAGGAGVYKTYGQSETFRSTALEPEAFSTKMCSVGKPFGGARIYVVDEDDAPCPPDRTGEILHTGLGAMLGYLSEHGRSDKLVPNPFCGASDPSPVAIRTGDFGYLDGDGYLYVRGRQDDMVKVAGNRVYPRESADALITLPQIVEAEVVGVKDAHGETQLVAFVIERASQIEEAVVEGPPGAVRRQLSKILPSYMMPREIVSLTSMPRTATGKPERQALTRTAEEMFKPSEILQHDSGEKA